MKPAAALTREIAAPTLTGVRQIISGHPASGITPERLASLLREAEAGDPTRYEARLMAGLAEQGFARPEALAAVVPGVRRAPPGTCMA